MYFINRKLNIKSICALVRLYSLARKSHYDVLKLRRSCTDKEIKDAFIQLSKEYHPDKNKDSKAQEHFVRIVEAYNILSKPSSRAVYDSTSEVASWSPPYRPPTSNMGSYSQNTSNSQSQYNFYSSKNQSAQSESHQQYKDYYGVHGVKKLPNLAIIAMCFGFAIVGLVVQMFVIRQSFTIHRKELNAKSKRIAEEYEKIRDSAKVNGNEVQSRLILEKIVSAANPSVATATLGQALANDKKEKVENKVQEPVENVISEVTDDRKMSATDEDIKVTYELIRKILTYFY